MRLPVGPNCAGVKGLVHLVASGGDQDVRGGMQIVLCVAADEFQVLREGHVAFDDASAHASAGLISLDRVLGELQCGAAMPD
jgi:hypothetical protein